MNFSLIYSKTAKGAAEIAARSGALTPAMRRVLIMVDGRRTAAELELVARDGEFESIIAALLEKGMIEQTGTVEADIPDWVDDDEEATVVMESPRGPDAIPALRGAAQAVAAPAPAPAPAPVEPRAPTLEERKRMAVRALYDRLGPYGEEPAARIQECKTLEELGEKLKHACRRIALFRGEQAAREYMASIGQV